MLHHLLVAVLGLALAAGASAQTRWPERPLRFIVGATPGGSIDFVARIVGERLSKVLGQPIVIDNKPGVGSSIATDFVAKAPPDGYTILVAISAGISINPALDPKWSSAHSLIPVAKLASSPLVVTTNPQSGFKTLGELVGYAKAHPGKLNYAFSGQGQQLAGKMFQQMTGVDVVAVPYKGGTGAIQSVLANDTQFTFATPPAVLPHLGSGKLVALAVSIPERSSLMPDLPSAREVGLPDFKVDSWFGLFVPEGTPDAVVQKLFDATNGILQRPELKSALAAGGMETSTPAPPAEFAAFVREENRVWGKLAKESGARLD